MKKIFLAISLVFFLPLAALAQSICFEKFYGNVESLGQYFPVIDDRVYIFDITDSNKGPWENKVYEESGAFKYFTITMYLECNSAHILEFRYLSKDGNWIKVLDSFGEKVRVFFEGGTPFEVERQQDIYLANPYFASSRVSVGDEIQIHNPNIFGFINVLFGDYVYPDIACSKNNILRFPSSSSSEKIKIPAKIKECRPGHLTAWVPKGAVSGPLYLYVLGVGEVDLGYSIKIVPPPSPRITGISRRSGVPGDVIEIYGSGFAADPSMDCVRVGGRWAKVISASSSKLVVLVPKGAGSGNITVEVYGRGWTSGPYFYVHSGGPFEGPYEGPVF